MYITIQDIKNELELITSVRKLNSYLKDATQDFCDVVNQVVMQHPQPNGFIYLHGDRITRLTVYRAAQTLTAIKERIKSLKSSNHAKRNQRGQD